MLLFLTICYICFLFLSSFRHLLPVISWRAHAHLIYPFHASTPAWPRPLTHLLSPPLRSADPTALSLTWFLFALISSENWHMFIPTRLFNVHCIHRNWCLCKKNDLIRLDEVSRRECTERRVLPLILLPHVFNSASLKWSCDSQDSLFSFRREVPQVAVVCIR